MGDSLVLIRVTAALPIVVVVEHSAAFTGVY